jgi:hypothetical protein
VLGLFKLAKLGARAEGVTEAFCFAIRALLMGDAVWMISAIVVWCPPICE